MKNGPNEMANPGTGVTVDAFEFCPRHTQGRMGNTHKHLDRTFKVTTMQHALLRHSDNTEADFPFVHTVSKGGY